MAGPFTVESLSPHRVLGVDEDDELIDALKDGTSGYGAEWSFPQMILENLKTAGVQQAHKEDRISFTSIRAWPGEYISGEGRYMEGAVEKRAAIFIGPEFGTVQRSDLVAAAREAGDGGFDVLIACAFNCEAHTTELAKLGRIPILKARMNADLHMADGLKNTGKGNLFVIFGEPGRPTSPCCTTPTTASASKSTASTSSSPRPAKSSTPAPTASPAGSSTRTTTRNRSSSATPTSSAPTTRTAR